MHRFAPLLSVLIPKAVITTNQSKSMAYGSCYIPAPSKRYRGGEDAHYIDAYTMIVADGVSQWYTDDDIDAGLYALQLVEELKTKAIQDAKVSVPGSATLCIAKLKDNSLDISHLGDAGVHVYRTGTNDTRWPIFREVIATSDDCGFRLVFSTKPMRHEDNVPFQLGSHKEADSAQAVIHNKFALHSGDIVVMGSDGLFDNIPDVSYILSAREFEHPHKLAWQIGTLASHTAECRCDDIDDITVLVGKVE